MSLTSTSIRNAKPGSKMRKLFDERGLYLELSPKGGKWWRFKYRFNSKEKRLSLGVYPDVTLKAARDRRVDARKLVANGIDPSANRKAQEEASSRGNGFEVVAREWFAIHFDDNGQIQPAFMRFDISDIRHPSPIGR